MFIFAILAGLIFNSLGLEKHLRNVNIRRSQTGKEQKESKWIIALKDAWNFFYPVLPYLLVGVLIGAVIHDFIPAVFISSFAGMDYSFAILIGDVCVLP